MKRLGRYEILSELGRGAMGTVYRARDPKIDRIVALKTITISGASAADEEEYRQRFFREAQAAGKLSHSGLVTIYDVGEDESTKTPFIVMEFIEGKTLEELGRGERLATPTVLGLAKQVAEALDYAHSRQIIHRDIKPANIIVTGDGQAKITDFGIAKLAMTQFTQPGQVLGTPAYMSPEQLSGGAVDGRADLFSLGVILYWLLTGDKPFAGDTTTAVSFKIVYKDPIPPTQLNPALSPHYDYALERALAKDPARRYQRGRELADDLDDLLAGRPPRSRARQAAPAEVEHTLVAQPRAPVPPTAPSTVKSPAAARPVARKPTPAAAAAPPTRKKPRWLLPVTIAGALLLLLAGVGRVWIGKSRARQQADRAAQQAAAGAPAQETGDQVRPEPAPARDTAPPASAPSRSEQAQLPPPVVPRSEDSQPRQAEPRRRQVAMATLHIVGEHNFDQATVFIYADEHLLRELNLQGRTASRRGARVGFGRIEGSLPVPAGQRTISIRIRAPRDDFDQIEYIAGDFRAGQTRTLEVSLGKLGKWVGIGGLTRRLTLRWLD